MREINIKHVAALDSMRAIAALLVFVQHFSQQYHPFSEMKLVERMLDALAQFGVAAFFVLSGFLIHSGGLAERSRNNCISWKKYFWRRSSRILPGYYASLIVCAAIVQFWQSALMSTTGWFGFVSHLFLFSSFYSAEYGSISGIFWTVVVECHFYAIYVIMWKVTKTENFVRVAVTFMVGSVLVFILGSMMTPPGPLRTMLQLTAPSLLWKWCLGALIAEACYSTKLPWIRKFFTKEWLVIPSVAVVLGGIVLNPSAAVNYNRFILPIGCFGLVCLCVFSGLGRRRNRFLEWSGVISYSIYLWHPLALLLGVNLTQLAGASAFVVTLLLTYVFAWLGYLYIEKPGMAYGKTRVSILR